MWAGIRALRRQRFDLAIDLQGLARSALFAWLANADLTVGLDNPGEGGREGARALYDLTPPRCRPGTHAVERYWAVLALLGVPVHRDFQWLPPRPLVAERVRAQVGHWIDRCVVVLPGARWENKRWPAEYFRELVERMLTTTRDLCFKVLGSAADRALAQVITQACPERVQDLTGQTSLPEMVEWIRLSRLVISNDTGPLHVAAALGRPVVAIFGPTDAATTGPYQQRSDVLQNNGLSCVPCLKDRCTNSKPLECLRSLTPARVCEAACQRLAGAT
jgi:lipopolysaccharide heptosyltransferase II